MATEARDPPLSPERLKDRGELTKIEFDVMMEAFEPLSDPDLADIDLGVATGEKFDPNWKPKAWG